MATQPGSLDLEQELEALRSRIDELTRRKATYPVCEAGLSVDATGLSGEVLAYGNWVALSDARGMFTPGAPGVLSKMAVPITGRYKVSYRATAFATTANVEARVYRNGTTTGHLIVVYGRAGSSGSFVSADAVREMILVEGDVIYWGNYFGSATTLRGGASGFYSAMMLRYIGTS